MKSITNKLRLVRRKILQAQLTPTVTPKNRLVVFMSANIVQIMLINHRAMPVRKFVAQIITFTILIIVLVF